MNEMANIKLEPLDVKVESHLESASEQDIEQNAEFINSEEAYDRLNTEFLPSIKEECTIPLKLPKLDSDYDPNCYTHNDNVVKVEPEYSNNKKTYEPLNTELLPNIANIKEEDTTPYDYPDYVYNKELDNIAEQYECLICQKRYNAKLALRSHITSHWKSRYLCTVCSKQCGFKCHLAAREGEKPYKCEICQERFTQKSDLTVHMRTHSDKDKPYECSICHKRFNSMRNFPRHMRTHTGDKPYLCNICHKRFNQKQILTVHMRTHTGDKPYECNICHKRFNHKQAFTVHMRSHTGDRPHVCNICHKRFNQKQHLTAHMRIHTRDKPFNCKIRSKNQ